MQRQRQKQPKQLKQPFEMTLETIAEEDSAPENKSLTTNSISTSNVPSKKGGSKSTSSKNKFLNQVRKKSEKKILLEKAKKWSRIINQKHQTKSLLTIENEYKLDLVWIYIRYISLKKEKKSLEFISDSLPNYLAYRIYMKQAKELMASVPSCKLDLVRIYIRYKSLKKEKKSLEFISDSLPNYLAYRIYMKQAKELMASDPSCNLDPKKVYIRFHQGLFIPLFYESPLEFLRSQIAKQNLQAQNTIKPVVTLSTSPEAKSQTPSSSWIKTLGFICTAIIYIPTVCLGYLSMLCLWYPKTVTSHDTISNSPNCYNNLSGLTLFNPEKSKHKDNSVTARKLLARSA